MRIQRATAVALAIGVTGLLSGCTGSSKPTVTQLSPFPVVSVPPAGTGSTTTPTEPPAGSGSESGKQAPTVSTMPPVPASPSGTGVPVCSTAEMTTGTWKQIAGSAGAGQVSADLAFQNTSAGPCTITGFPRLTLLSAAGAILPTTVTDFDPASAAPLTVPAGGWVRSELRYSPDIPGGGEPQTGPCEPTATTAAVRLPGDTALAHVTLTPATPVCEQGSITAKAFVSGPASPPGG